MGRHRAFITPTLGLAAILPRFAEQQLPTSFVLNGGKDSFAGGEQAELFSRIISTHRQLPAQGFLLARLTDTEYL